MTEEQLYLAIKQMREAFLNENWELLSTLMLIYTYLYNYSFEEYYKYLPDPIKRETAIEAYTCHGDEYGKVRQAVRSLARKDKFGLYLLPQDLNDTDIIQVFRSGIEPIEKAPSRISWTTDINIATWFHNRNQLIGKESHIYSAKIYPKNVIAYVDNRNEKEIMQYRKVFDTIQIV